MNKKTFSSFNQNSDCRK